MAKSLHFVTEVKKNIFVELMSSQDYIEATKRLLELKIKRLEDLASVLVEVNIQEGCIILSTASSAAKWSNKYQSSEFVFSLQFGIESSRFLPSMPGKSQI